MMVQHAAVPVSDVLVEAEVGHQHDVVAELVAQRAQGDLHDARRIVGAGPTIVLVDRYAEEDDTLHAHVAQRAHLVVQRREGVLDVAGQRRDRTRLVEPLAYEERGDQVIGRE